VFDSVLVANRGEIAVRVIRTLRTLGIRSVGVFSDADAGAPHTRLADDAIRIGPASAADSYLAVDRVVAAARSAGAQAVHPGYGFLAENAGFARACADAGVVFVGPPADAIEAMGDKIAAKRLAVDAGAPVVPGVHEPGMTDAQLTAAAPQVGYPLLVKAVAGGGGKGMRVVGEEGGLAEAIAAARREAAGAFGDDALLLERYVDAPRHIEIQVLADAHGTVVHLGERECSLQRRHQKIVEEAPSPVLDETGRARMGEAAVGIARAVGYTGAGTVEFLWSAGEFFFLEMNTRLQVEHPVTEAVYGLDLVEWQLRVAAGEKLSLDPERLTPRGHAIEARVYAEDPARGFLPTGGRILVLREPHARARVDSGVAEGMTVGSHYDPMLAKVIAHGADRAEALHRLDAALAQYTLLGVTTNVAFLRALLGEDAVRAGDLDTGLVDRRAPELAELGVPDDVLAAAALARLAELEPPPGAAADPFALPGGWRIGEHAWERWRLQPLGGEPFEVATRGRAAAAEVRIGEGDPQPVTVALVDDGLEVVYAGERRVYAYAVDGDVAWLGRDGCAWALREQEQLAAARHADVAAPGGPLVAPMPGTVAAVHVAAGDEVSAGQALVVVEAMKMEHPVVAAADGTVSAVHVKVGDQVGMEDPLVEVDRQ
jgi:acetyl-CoA/propionyl-CoA carboxylase, biotin carboxylase, biotin carboxyl carrier protein